MILFLSDHRFRALCYPPYLVADFLDPFPVGWRGSQQQWSMTNTGIAFEAETLLQQMYRASSNVKQWSNQTHHNWQQIKLYE